MENTTRPLPQYWWRVISSWVHFKLCSFWIQSKKSIFGLETILFRVFTCKSGSSTDFLETLHNMVRDSCTPHFSHPWFARDRRRYRASWSNPPSWYSCHSTPTLPLSQRPEPAESDVSLGDVRGHHVLRNVDLYEPTSAGAIVCHWYTP